ncbi:MAG: hypothetical protein J6N93_07650, partial [Clostridia bacterium]|nr:hypothetical protein [Clostridia bacterium]
LDYVNVYTSKTEFKTLREIYKGSAQSKIWGEANSLGFAVDENYHGTAVYAVEIKAGAQFPASTNGYTTYVVGADVTYYNSNYNSEDTSINSFSVSWTTDKPAETELGTPDVEFTGVDTEYNNTVWGDSMALALNFNANFEAKAYDGNKGGFDSLIISAVKTYTKINGASGAIQLSLLLVDNSNRILFLYDSSLLTVPEGQKYTTFTIEAGAPFGGKYLPAVTLYFVDGKWCENEPVTEEVTVTNIHDRNGGDQRLLLFISNSDYNTPNTELNAKLSSVNVLDYVNVYTSKTEFKTLREIYKGSAQSKIWGEANSLGFAVDENYHGTAVYAVEIKAGAQFPASTNGYTTYVVGADVTYYNSYYNSDDTSINGFSVNWTTEKPAEIEFGTPDVEFTGVDTVYNNSVWGGSTMALALNFNANFEAKAYDGNEGGYDSPIISSVKKYTKIGGKGDVIQFSLLMEPNANKIVFLYDNSILTVPEGQKYITFTIDEGVPFGGKYLPAVTLYFNGETWQTEKTEVPEKLLGVVETQNNTAWGDTQKAVRLRFNYTFNNTANYNINDADGLNMISKLTFDGASLTDADILIFTEDIAGSTITILYNNTMLDRAKADGARYHTLALTESVNYLGVNIPAFTLYLKNDAWTTELLPVLEMADIETAVGYQCSDYVHIRDWNLDGDETTAVNNMIVFFLPGGGFPESHNLFMNLEKVAEYNVFDKIRLHMITPNDEADKDGFVTLGQVFNAGGWYPSELSGGKDKIVCVNIWETVNSIAFSMGAAYTAESFDYIIVEKDCEFPNYYYTNKCSGVDYVQNGEVVDYENLKKVSLWQTQTVKIYTNPDDFQGPSLNTNWAVDTNMGKVEVSGVDYADGYVIIQLDGLDYPTEAEGDDLNQNISAGNVPMSLNMLADIYVNGISLYDRVVHFGGNGITSYYNYKGYGNFAVSVVLADENEVVTEIIVAKRLRVPLYEMSDMAAAAYGIMYKETASTVSYSKGDQGFSQNEQVLWTVIFNDGENVKTVKVEHGAMLAASDIPETPVKKGYEFVAWVYGIDGINTFLPTSDITTCYYLTAEWKEADDTESTESEEKGDSGCFGSVGGSVGAMAALLALASVCILKKKEN